MKSIISSSLFTVLLFGQLLINAQTIKPLKIGDKVPNLLLKKMLYHTNPTGNLKDFDGKAMIIDQWFIGCAPCTSAMPHLDSVQKEFVKDLQILLVTHDKMNDVVDFWKSNIIVKGIKLTQVVEDRLIRSYFPAVSFPQQVWIDRNRTVVAITDGKGMNKSNINKLITGQKLSLSTKKDELDLQVRNAKQPNIISRFEESKKKLLYYSYFSKYRPELSGISKVETDTITNLVRVVNNNTTLGKLYDFAYANAYRGPFGSEWTHLPSRLIRKDTNPIKSFTTPGNKADTIFRFCYELIYSNKTRDSLKNLMIADLDKFFNLKSHEELMDVEGYVIKPNGKGAKYYDTYQPERKMYWTISLEQAKRILVNDHTRAMVEHRINELSPVPIFLEIDDTHRINFDTRWDIKNLDLMNADLVKFDLKIEKVTRKKKVIILEDQ